MKRMILKTLLPFALMTSGSNMLLAADPVWQVVGSAGFGGTGYNAGAKYLTMSLNSSSTPYVAFVNDGNYDKATVMKYNGSTWVQLGLTLPSYAETSSTSIAIHSSGVPYVVYIAPDDLYTGYWANVVKYDGSSWVNEGNANFGNGATTNLVIDSTGTPLVAYRDADNSYDGTVKNLVNGSWVTVGNSGIDLSVPIISLDSQNVPYAVSQYAATVKKFDGNSWVLVGNADFASGDASECSIAVNSKDVPYVAFKDGDKDNNVTVMKYDGMSWVLVGKAGFSVGSIKYQPSIAIDKSDTPYIAYSNNNSTQQATVMKFDGSSWSVVGEAGFSAAGVSNISLTLNNKGVPYVSYRDTNIYNRATVMYAPSITCAYKVQGESECIPGTPVSDPGAYPDLLDRNYVQGDISVIGDRTADAGWQGEYDSLCRDEASVQGAYPCPR